MYKRALLPKLLFLSFLGFITVKGKLLCQVHDNIKFQHIEANLSENTVTAIVQDYKGFLWFGTRNGLNRYNGADFSVYEHFYNDSTSLSHSYINCLFEDNKKNLWVGTLEGLNLYNRNKDTFVRFKYRPNDLSNLGHNTVNVIYEDSDLNLWIGTENGLYLYNPDSGTITPFYHKKDDPQSLSNNDVRVLFEDMFSNLWVGTYGGGLNLLDMAHDRFIHYKNALDTSSISSNFIKTSFTDKDGNIWIGTKNGLNLMVTDQNGFKFKRYLHNLSENNCLSHNTIAAISEDDNGNLWIGTENGGLSIYHKDSHSFARYGHDALDPASIGSNSIWSIFRDNIGTMWIGCLNRGLYKWDKYQNKFEHYKVNASGNSLSNNNITCFLEDEVGNLWIGTDGGGLNYFDRKTRKFTHYQHDPFNENSLGSDAVIAIFKDSQNNLWVGTWQGGLNLFDRETKQFKRYMHNPEKPTSIGSDNVFTMLEDSQGRFWVGVFGRGLDLFDRNSETFTHFTHDPDDVKSLSNNKVFKIFEDSRQNIWIGTEGGGLNLLHTGAGNQVTFTRHKHDQEDTTSLSENVIITMEEDSRGRLWVGTYGGGLNRFDSESQTFKAYRKSDGLPNNVVHGILEDDAGNLWLSTNKGIAKFDPETEAFRNYTKADGLQSKEFIRGSCLKTTDGKFFFGGVNGFNAFYPDEIADNPNAPPVYITDFRIAGKSVKPGGKNSPLQKQIMETKDLTLPYHQNVFSFAFTALNYSQDSKNQYAYKLEGYDKDWHSFGNERNAYYTKVPHGKYTFKVKGSNNDGIWNKKGASIKITIKPPWYLTWWAYGLYITAALTLFAWYRKSLIKGERIKSHLRLEHLALLKMQEVDQLKSNFFANISHEFRTPLTLILGPLKSMYSGDINVKYKKQLAVMIRNADTLLKLINELLDLSKLGAGSMKLRASRQNLGDFVKTILDCFESYAAQQHIHLKFNAPAFLIEVYFDPDKLQKALSNLISNAIKFSSASGTVTVNLSLSDNENKTIHHGQPAKFARIEVVDNGVGMSAEQVNQIFNRFYQAETSDVSDLKGTGLGLSITKELIELHKGRITVRSEVNQGSCFEVLLLMGRTHLKDEEIITDCNNNGKGLIRARLKEKRISGSLSPAEEPLAKEHLAEEQKIRKAPVVLVVEDNPDMRAYIVRQLDAVYDIEEAANGHEGWQKAVAILPHLIISDVMMPRMNGYELCKKIKSDSRTSHIPVLLLTARASLENQLESIQTGADYYIPKPFNSKLLNLRIKNIIQSRELLKAQFTKTLQLEPGKISIHSSNEKFLKAALESIERNMTNAEFGVKDFGRELGISRMQLYRKLKALTGLSANELVRSIRLKRAAQLLGTGEFTIAEITYQVGFNDLRYFRNCFKKQFGVTPSSYAQKAHKKDRD